MSLTSVERERVMKGGVCVCVSDKISIVIELWKIYGSFVCLTVPCIMIGITSQDSCQYTALLHTVAL